MPSAVERKIKPDGTVREFSCELIFLAGGLAVLRFILANPGAFNTPIAFPPGTISDGYFWKRRPYNVYRFRSAEGAPLAHRFDALRDVALGPSEVRYRDLVLDWWALADGTLLEEDRDEFEALATAGVISKDDCAVAEAAARQVFSRYRHIIDEVASLEAKRER